MANILIYGGTGIISSEVVNRAIQDGHSVTMLNRGNRKKFFNSQAKLIIADLSNDDIKEIRGKIPGEYDCVIDFYSRKRDDLDKCMAIAGEITKQYIFISSAVVYQNSNGRISESDSIGDSVWDYANEKVECENYLKEKAGDYIFTYTVVRPYVTYNKTRIPFQFAPMRYYTLIHRMKYHKVIPLFGQETMCTLTSSIDFAIGLVGLVGNEKAFNNCYHITGDYETSWENVLNLVADAFQMEYETINVPLSVLEDRKITRSLSFDEVTGDKGRNMLFDNRKIKEAVPGFEGKRSLQEELAAIVHFFNEEKTNRQVDQYWEGKLDGFLIRSGLLNKEQTKNLKYCSSEDARYNDRFKYLVGRFR